jgi:hypothetical protein
MGHYLGIIFGCVGLALVLLTGTGVALLLKRQTVPARWARTDQE